MQVSSLSRCPDTGSPYFSIFEMRLPWEATLCFIFLINTEYLYPQLLLFPCDPRPISVRGGVSETEYICRGRLSTPGRPEVPNKKTHVTLQRSSASRMNLPSLYFSVVSYALSYFHPTVSLHCRQVMSRTICLPVVMLRSLGSPMSMFTTLLNR